MLTGQQPPLCMIMSGSVGCCVARVLWPVLPLKAAAGRAPWMAPSTAWNFTCHDRTASCNHNRESCNINTLKKGQLHKSLCAETTDLMWRGYCLIDCRTRGLKASVQVACAAYLAVLCCCCCLVALASASPMPPHACCSSLPSKQAL